MTKTKRLILFLFCIFILSPFISTKASSQENNKPPARKTILDYKAEVGLNEKQVKEIEKLIGEYEKRVASNVEKIKGEDKKLKELLASEGDIKEIGKRVREIYRLRGEIVVDDLETGRKIDNILTKEQKEKWKEIKKVSTQNQR
ncbi:MAG: hypothetical protein N3D17_07810 [bacterium]|nr:hypothetical protein [bacterium]